MTLDRHLARLLAAVIVMIAATFSVAVAQAHEGHAHHHPAPAVSVAPVATAPVQEAAMPAAALVSVEADTTPLRVVARVTQMAPSVGQTALAVSAPNAGDCGDCSGCNGLCCGMGMVCCHSALSPASMAVGWPATLAVIVPTLQQAAPPSLAPEALPKPPRPFA